MVQRHVLSVVFLALISANVIQAGVIIPSLQGLFHQDALPNFVNLLDIPRIGQFSHDLASSAASAAARVRSYMDDFGTGLGGLNVLPRLHGLFNGGLLSGLGHPAILNGAADTIADSVATSLVPSEHLRTSGLFGRGLLGRGLLGRGLLGKGLLGNYEAGGSSGGAASAAASSATGA
ncbi:uncharacterized protein LOC114931553 [Nylanderia fulva]|uniref:uncharacterized protein LOC114931553 n=1 Tax=Nylanderia fulva TaxID=613905 RepID=UPI0010FBB1AD|nr:uncharacterized protein LOC114931553 [Nylanderia fulva]